MVQLSQERGAVCVSAYVDPVRDSAFRRRVLQEERCMSAIQFELQVFNLHYLVIWCPNPGI